MFNSLRFVMKATSKKKSIFVLVFVMVLTVTALCFALKNVWIGRAHFVERQESAVAQPTPVPSDGGFIRRGRMPSRLREVLGELGDRLEKPGKERLSFVGNLKRPGASGAIPFRLFQEFPRRMRLEEQGEQARALGFDGSKVWALGGRLNAIDLDMIETFVFDSIDHFFLGQMEGIATRNLGTRFRLDDGTNPKYAGPFYDIYEVNDRITLGGGERRQPKLLYVNSDSRQVERIQYRLDRNGNGVKVEIRFNDWRKSGEQLLAHSIERLENGQSVFLLNITASTVGARQNDGIFTAP